MKPLSTSARLALLIAVAALLGAAPAADDDKVIAKPTDTPRQLPEQVDLRPQFTDYALGPRRQGKRGTCSVFTTVAAIEFALARHTGHGEMLSVEYLNWASNQAIHHNGDGGFFHDLLKGYAQHGVCSESEMPYQRTFDAEQGPSEQALASGGAFLKKPVEIHWINPWKRQAGLTEEQLTEIKTVLAAGWPVAAGSSHSRLIVGYVDDPQQPGGGTFLTKDSGRGRFATITYAFAKEKIGDVFWVEMPLQGQGKLCGVQ